MTIICFMEYTQSQRADFIETRTIYYYCNGSKTKYDSMQYDNEHLYCAKILREPKCSGAIKKNVSDENETALRMVSSRVLHGPGRHAAHGPGRVRLLWYFAGLNL